MQNNINVEDTQRVAKASQEAQIRFPSFGQVQLDGQDVSTAIRESRIVRAINPVASNPSVRQAMAEQQRALARRTDYAGFEFNKQHITGVVMDGRDIGTVILPDAELKVFIVADARTRAERRFKELKGNGNDTIEDIARDLAARDEADRTRTVSPLKKADDAVELDTSQCTIDQQVDAIEAMVHHRLAAPAKNQ